MGILPLHATETAEGYFLLFYIGYQWEKWNMYHIDLRDGKINEQMNNYNNVCFVTCALSKLFLYLYKSI